MRPALATATVATAAIVKVIGNGFGLDGGVVGDGDGAGDGDGVGWGVGVGCGVGDWGSVGGGLIAIGVADCGGEDAFVLTVIRVIIAIQLAPFALGSTKRRVSGKSCPSFS